MKKIIIFTLITTHFLISCAATTQKNEIVDGTKSQPAKNNTSLITNERKSIIVDTNSAKKDQLTDLLTMNNLNKKVINTNKTQKKHVIYVSKSVKKNQINEKKFKLQIGAFSDINKIDEIKFKVTPILKQFNSKLKLITVTQKSLYKLQIGYFDSRQKSEACLKYLKSKKINAFIIKPHN